MSDNRWPATARQRAYGIALEDQLDEPESMWNAMTVTEASHRIDELVTLKTFRQIVEPLSEATEGT
ncbi:hypothetical protein ASC55_03525 [Microbacterium sp. Root322]|uniref:DUF3072 domain-containing protein n=1 Tax=Microbacterium sp. Root322 TaxID=1736514 RepID=UPI0006F922A5|nr:DUF3072 domain-containing protein [Microbacterium sp. Root322]KQV04045.1 hypothetical protein ASC55_03525 [Microbacterium sp. Root322]